MSYRCHAILFVLAAMCLCATSVRAMPLKEALQKTDPGARYLFYLHGAALEEQGRHANDNRYGKYKYDSIIEHFEDRGFIVIEEVRGKVNPAQYSDKVVRDVRKLMAAGVPASHITVSGFSKGGHITLLVASSLGNPDVNYIIMAGCGRGKVGHGFKRFLKHKRGARLKGRILSIYASSDLDAGSCQPAMDQASGQGLTFKEIRIKSTKGHGLFFQPRPEWIDPSARFAMGGR